MRIAFIVLVCLFMTVPATTKAEVDEVKLSIKLQGVYSSNINLMPMAGSDAYRSVAFKEGIRNGETVVFILPKDLLPGQFTLRFDYIERPSLSSYPSEKKLIIGLQDLNLTVNPIYTGNTDSTHFQDGELENTAFSAFNRDKNSHLNMIGLLQDFLLKYDEPKSDFYQEAIQEYENRRIRFNNWVDSQVSKNKGLFAASLITFEKIPYVSWEGTQDDRMRSFLENYFDGIDMKDSLLLKLADLDRWMGRYVNLHLERVKDQSMLDSTLMFAGKVAIETAKNGHPKVYGWMVDYFFDGYQRFEIQKGIAMLEPYLNDPNCKTRKRQAIEQRLKGIENIKAGEKAPDFFMPGQAVSFHKFNTDAEHKLLLFWSSACSHCKDLNKKLYQWHQKHTDKIEVIAISLDESEGDINLWQEEMQKTSTWNHILAEGGINSEAAEAYFVLSTPFMVLVETQSNIISEVPVSVSQIEAYFE